MYKARRDGRFEYAADAIAHIEQYNCVHGCLFADNATPEMPGGQCDTLLAVTLSDDVGEINDLGDRLECTRRIPI